MALNCVTVLKVTINFKFDGVCTPALCEDKSHEIATLVEYVIVLCTCSVYYFNFHYYFLTLHEYIFVAVSKNVVKSMLHMIKYGST